MKRIGLFLLTVVMTVGMAGCSSDNNDADPVGKWAITLDRNCTGSLQSGVMSIYSNRHFADSWLNGGSWTVSKSEITLKDSEDIITYRGNIDGDTITGTADGGGHYCWTATRTSTTP